MIVLTDASVIIDLWHVDGLSVLTELAPIEVLDVVVDECEDERQPGIVPAINAAGINIIEVQHDWLRIVTNRTGWDRLSVPDRLNLHYAKAFERTLLATDNLLRRTGLSEGIAVHGSLWLIEQINEHNFLPASDLCAWLDRWHQIGSRLPTEAVKDLKQVLGCK